MDYFAELCIWIKELDIGQKVYMSFHILSILTAIPFFVWLGKKMNVKPSKAVMGLLIDSIVFYALMMFIGWAGTGFKSFGARNVITVFVWGPLVFFIGAKLSGMERNKLCAISTPALPLIHGLTRPGCMIVGCCKGYESVWGIYNVQTKGYRFPVQPLEMVLSFVVAAVFVYILKRKKYEPSAWLYPLMLFAYGIIQFLCDFLRDNQKLYFGCSLRGLHAFSMIVVGAVWLAVIIYKTAKKQKRTKKKSCPKGCPQ